MINSLTGFCVKRTSLQIFSGALKPLIYIQGFEKELCPYNFVFQTKSSKSEQFYKYNNYYIMMLWKTEKNDINVIIC